LTVVVLCLGLNHKTNYSKILCVWRFDEEW
jgi:hypothetical protein